jgi:hypothetical protein
MNIIFWEESTMQQGIVFLPSFENLVINIKMIDKMTFLNQ